MSSVCRVCLTANTRLHSLKNNLLIAAYEKLSDTKFNSEDARPRALCYSCNQKLVRCLTFSQMVHRSEKIFNHLFHQGLETTQENMTRVKQGMKQQFSVTTMQYTNIDDNTTDEGSHVTIKDEPIPSIDIKEEVITEQDKLIEPVPETFTNSVIFEEDNSDRGNDMEELPSNSHVEQTKSNDLKMSLIKLFFCNECDKRYRHKSDLGRHMKLHTGVKPFACNACDKQFYQKSGLVRHMGTHTGKKPFSCIVCVKKFSVKSSLIGHMRTHTGEKPFGCNVCQKQFSHKGNFVNHMRIHTGEKRFPCVVCDKQFNQKSNLVEHMRTHTGEKPFVCNVCAIEFNHKKSLVFHMRTHTGEGKPFACNVCDKQFHQKAYLFSHIRTHTGEKPFVCNVCVQSWHTDCL